jgi:hypothetical protein
LITTEYGAEYGRADAPMSKNPPVGGWPRSSPAALISLLFVAAAAAGDYDDWKYDGRLHRLVATADRVVIRDGGLDCCCPVDGQKVLLEIRGTNAVQEFARLFVVLTNQVYNQGAAYCGYPGLDWYRGTNRIALTAFHSNLGLIWTGFPAVARLSDESLRWATDWLLKHNIRGPDREVQPVPPATDQQDSKPMAKPQPDPR